LKPEQLHEPATCGAISISSHGKILLDIERRKIFILTKSQKQKIQKPFNEIKFNKQQ